MLYIVSTPIGNLKDITLRAIEVLKQADLIASEDTRHTGILLKHYGITTPQTSYFEHNQVKKIDYLMRFLEDGRDVALVSDAGTPGISDPGYRLIEAAYAHNIAVTVVPGPCAAVAALVASGLPADRFCFEGFLPVKTAARRKKLESLNTEERTIIFYESPHRLVKALRDIQEVLKNPVVGVARELTKKFEEIRRGSAQELTGYFSSRTVKGEIVLLVNLKADH